MSRPERMLNPDRSALDRFGYELRKWRKEQRLSQDRLGALVHVSGDLIYRIELGDRHPSRDFAIRCDQALKTRDVLARLWDDVDAERSRSRSGDLDTDKVTDNAGNANQDDSGTAQLESGVLGIPAAMLWGSGTPVIMATEITSDTLLKRDSGEDINVIPCQTSDGRIILVSIPRRAFLIGGISATAAGVATGSFVKNADASALPGRLHVAEGDPFERFYKMRKLLRDADNLFGPERVKPLVYAQIGLIRQLSNAARGKDRKRLLAVQAQFADLYGWLHQDTGNYQKAQYWLDRALDWSQMLDDSEAVSFILARKSQLSGELNDPTDAVGVAEVAIRRAQSGHWRSAAVAATYGAHGYALQGDKLSCEREYGRAYEMLRQVHPDVDTSYGLFLNNAYIDVQRAHSLAVLGDNTQAAEAFGKAIGLLPDGYHRDRGIYYVRKSLAHANGEDPEQAAEAGLQALAIGTETNSARIITGLARLNRTLTPWNTLPYVAEFRHALAEVRFAERASFTPEEEGK